MSLDAEKWSAEPGWLPGDWPQAAFDAMVSVVGPCPTGKCCTAETDGDACPSCTEVHVKIAEAIKPYVRDAIAAEQRARLEAVREAAKAVCFQCWKPDVWQPPYYVEGFGWFHDKQGAARGTATSNCEAFEIYARWPEAARPSASEGE